MLVAAGFSRGMSHVFVVVLTTTEVALRLNLEWPPFRSINKLAAVIVANFRKDTTNNLEEQQT